MTRWEFKLPDIGEGVTEGEVVAWLVNAGDAVREDQPMVEVMTDKATVTITSPKAGTIAECCAKVGEVVKVHATLVVYDLDGGATAAPAPAAAGPAPAAKRDDKGPAATAVGDIKEDLPGMSLMNAHAPARVAAPAPVTSGYFADKPLATPATRQVARDLGVDLRRVPPTGPSGRVSKEDVERFAKAAPASASPGASHAPSATPAPASASTSSTAMTAPSAAREAVKIAPSPSSGADADQRIPFVGVRRKIAERMSTSKNTAAHFTFVEECDCTELKALRERLKPRAEKEGVKLTFLAFIAKAVVAAMKKHPTLNSALDESTNELVIRKSVHLGIAASTDSGLVVPVVRDADRRSILDLARDIERVGTAAKQGKLKPQDLSGSTFTITSLGATGGLFATPIINFPEVAILGVHQMKQKPVVKNGQIVIGDVMLLSLSFDHRIIDGHIGAAFAYEVIGYLQEPDRLMLEA
jgi:pyruvate dehydrogenase E2 component (dihydrolipoamide acetyltransferase)